MSQESICRYEFPDGRRCRACAVKDTGYCWQHDPARVEARQKGGPAGPPLLSAVPPLESLEDVRRLLKEVTAQVVTAQHADTGRAQTVATLCGVLLRAVSIRDLQRRIDQLSAELEDAQGGRRDLDRALQYARDDVGRLRAEVAEYRRRHAEYRAAVGSTGAAATAPVPD
jgi:chromosome segregation ATPase